MLLTEQQKTVLRAVINNEDLLNLGVNQLPATLRSLERKGLIDELNQPTEKAHKLYHRIMSRRSL